MQENELLELAREAGFEGAVLAADRVPTDAKFRPFCAENRCGQYNANYSCPPTCGTPEQMAEKIYAGKTALVLKTQWPIDGYEDTKTIKDAKLSHNRAMLRLNERLRGLCVGGSCCCLCSPCRMPTGEACLYPDLRFSCMSAYCVDVAELAKRCGMDFRWDTKMLSVYSMIVM